MGISPHAELALGISAGVSIIAASLAYVVGVRLKARPAILAAYVWLIIGITSAVSVVMIAQTQSAITRVTLVVGFVLFLTGAICSLTRRKHPTRGDLLVAYVRLNIFYFKCMIVGVLIFAVGCLLYVFT